MPRKDNRVVSKISTKAECYVCRHFFNAETLYPLEKHHFLHGRGTRKLADSWGLFAYVCSRHHRQIHDQGKFDKELQHIAQETFIKERMKEGMPEDAAREYFKQIFGRFYP